MTFETTLHNLSFEKLEIMEKYGEYQYFTTDYKRFRADKEENRNP